VVDLPGIYSLELDLPESRVAVGALAGADGRPPDLVVVVADATNLVRHLLLVGELSQRGLPFVLVLNMMDLARRKAISYDLSRLALGIGAPVVAVSARRGEGLDRLLEVMGGVADGSVPRGLADVPEGGTEALEAWAEQVVAASVGGPAALGAPSDTVIDRLDAAFTHPLAGLGIFFLVMAGLFWVIFALAAVPMDLIEATFAHLGEFLTARLPAGAVRDLLVGGLIGG